VQLLLEKGADIEAKDTDLQTSLHYAVKARGTHWTGNAGTIRYLIEHNANTDVRDRWGQRPRDFAEKNPRLNLCEAGLLDLKTEKQRQKRTERNRRLIFLFLLGFILAVTLRSISRRQSTRARAKNRRHTRA
jgi:hypothetical protein